MIASFANRLSEDLFHGRSTAATRRFPPNVRKALERRLDLLNAACRLRDLRIPPGNRLEALNGDYLGLFSIRVNDQWRLVFRWEDGQPHDVRVVDYHR